MNEEKIIINKLYSKFKVTINNEKNNWNEFRLPGYWGEVFLLYTQDPDNLPMMPYHPKPWKKTDAEHSF